MRLIAALLLVLLATACRKDRQPDVPQGVIIKPEVVTVTRTVYVSLPSALTDQRRAPLGHPHLLARRLGQSSAVRASQDRRRGLRPAGPGHPPVATLLHRTQGD